MNLLEKATTITTATAYDDGKLHSVKGGSVADFDVVRGSAATRVNAEGLIEDVAANIPRIDYTDGTASILLEPQSTNLIENSDDFSDAYWSKLLMTATDNSSISPSGNVNASLIQEEIYTNSIPAIKNSGSITGLNGNNTLSFYVKNNSGRYLGVSFGSNAQRIRTNFDFDTETFKTPIFNGTTTGSVSFDKLGDYYRILITANFTTATDAQIYIIPLATDTYPFYAFQNSDNRSFYLWGAQLEALPYSTSYIPTSGAIATRLADVITGAGDVTTFNSTEGVLYAEMAALANTTSFEVISLSNGSSSDIVGFVYRNTTNSFTASVKSGGSTSLSKTITLADATEFIKVAISYKLNEFKFYINGVLEFTDTAGNTPIGLNTLQFTDGNGTSNKFKGKVKSVITFDTALTDAELECLTTI